jgi:GST-like protein
MPLFESGVILVYLAEKTGQLVPGDEAAQYQTRQWVAFQVGGPGPMFGQVGFFNKFDGRHIEDKRPLERYVDESKRLLGVLETQLERHAWIAGEDYSIADIATFPWVRNLVNFYEARDLVGFSDFPAVGRALDAFLARPAVARGLTIPAKPA